jgi:hypothetical protein
MLGLIFIILLMSGTAKQSSTAASAPIPAVFFDSASMSARISGILKENTASNPAKIIPFDVSRSAFTVMLPSELDFKGKLYYCTQYVVDCKNSHDVKNLNYKDNGEGLGYSIYGIRGIPVSEAITTKFYFPGNPPYEPYAVFLPENSPPPQNKVQAG